MKRTGNILILLLITIIATSCDGGDRDRIPAAAVRVEFANQAMWDQYGVSGSFIHRRFILNQKIPAGFPYTLSSATGYGGLMLITNEPLLSRRNQLQHKNRIRREQSLPKMPQMRFHLRHHHRRSHDRDGKRRSLFLAKLQYSSLWLSRRPVNIPLISTFS